MTLKRSELKEMIREVIREELQRRSLHEAPDDAQRKAQEEQRFNNWLRGREIIDEDGLMSSLGRHIEDCLGGHSVPGEDGKLNDTATGRNLHYDRTTMDNGLTSVYTYTLATGIPESEQDFLNDKNGLAGRELKAGFEKLKQFKPHHDGMKLKHELYCKKGTLYYRLVMMADWDKSVLWSKGYPDIRRGQTQKDWRF